MGSGRFQYLIARVWLKKSLSIDEILGSLGVKRLLSGAVNFSGARGETRLLVRIRSGTAHAARKLDIYADTNVVKELKSTVEQLLPIFTLKDLAEEGSAIIEKQQDEDESELWDKAKNQLMRVVLDLCDHPLLRKERDRRISRKIGFPAYFAWVSTGRDVDGNIVELSRRITGEIIKELADELMSFSPPGDLSTAEHQPKRGWNENRKSDHLS
jgi:hypothetical protein